MSKIFTRHNGLTVIAKAKDFPRLADLEIFLDLRPAGRAARVAAALDAMVIEGQAS